MELPSKFVIEKTLTRGSVYLYSDKQKLNTDIPHYYIVLNQNPTTDLLLLLVWCRHDANKVRRLEVNTAANTFVEIKKGESRILPKDSLVNCNKVDVRTIKELINLHDAGNLVYKGVMEEGIIQKLINGVLASNLVPKAQQRILDPNI